MKRIVLVVVTLASALAPSAQPPAYDLVIRNARIVDGTGTPWYRSDLAVRGDTIVEVAATIDAGGARVIEAAGQVVTPGFIDIHTHARRGSIRILDSVRETIAIGEGGGLPTQVTHHKIIGKANWGRSVDTLRLIDEARARGVEVTSDQYPYTASSTSVSSALMPAWALAGWRASTLARLKDPAVRAKVRADTIVAIRDARGGGDPKNVQFASCGFDASLAGKTLADLTTQRGIEPTLENAADVTLWIFEQGGCQGIFHAMSDDDVPRIMQHPTTMIGSDGEVPVFGRANPHPRSYGTFARVLGRYVREKKALTLEEAIRKMTAFPATRLKLTDRGILRPGMKADVVLFDPATVRDTATFETPHSYAEGSSHVIVNGVVVTTDQAEGLKAER